MCFQISGNVHIELSDNYNGKSITIEASVYALPATLYEPAEFTVLGIGINGIDIDDIDDDDLVEYVTDIIAAYDNSN